MSKRRHKSLIDDIAATPSVAETSRREKSLLDRLRAAEKLIEQQQERIDRLAVAKFSIPTQRQARTSKGCKVRLIVPDTHGSALDPMAASAMFADCERLKPQEIIHLGDAIDCGGFLAQHHVWGYVAEAEYTFEQDVVAANMFFDRLQALAPKADFHLLEGNHDCVTPDHEVLTSNGWMPIEQVTVNDLVATMNDDRNVEWQYPLATICTQYNDELVTAGGPFMRFAVTKKHRLWSFSQSDKLICERAGDLANITTTRTFPVAVGNPQEEYHITDSDIRLTAWILTDGCLTGAVSIFQSKANNFDVIRDVIRSAGENFTENSRHRSPPEISGVQVKSSLPETIFRLSSKSSRNVASRLFGISDWNCKDRQQKSIPKWVWKLSQRQFDVFLESLIDGDGTRNNGGRHGSSYTLYGKLDFLDSMQALLCVNGYRASLSKRYVKASGAHYWCLNISKRSTVKYQCLNLQKKPYCGNVYCLTMANDNFIVRHRGRVHVTGNCRIEKWCVTQALRNRIDAAYLKKMFGVRVQLHIEKRGIYHWEQGKRYMGCRIPATIRLGNCFFTHGTKHGKNAASAMLSRFAGNVVFGHVHKLLSASDRTVKDGEIGAWCPGSLCFEQPLWRHSDPTDWCQGYGVQLVRPNGDFLHINVPIIGGKSYLVDLLGNR